MNTMTKKNKSGKDVLALVFICLVTFVSYWVEHPVFLLLVFSWHDFFSCTSLLSNSNREYLKMFLVIKEATKQVCERKRERRRN